MLVSSTSMNAAIATTTPMSQGLYFGRQGAGGRGLASAPVLLDINFGNYGHTGPQPVVVILVRFQVDAYGKALHDLHIVAGCVLRREQAQARAAGAGDSRH